MLATGLTDGTVRLWDLSSGRQCAKLKPSVRFLDPYVRAVAFSPDGSALATSNNIAVHLWDADEKHELAVLLMQEGKSITSIAFRPDGTMLAVSLRDGTVRLWDVMSKSEQMVLKAKQLEDVEKVAFSPDGKILAYGSSAMDKTVRLWDVAHARELAELPMIEYKTAMGGTVEAIAFSPDGTTLAVGLFDGTVRLWDATNWRKLAVLKGHTKYVDTIAFNPDGTLLASSSYDRTVRLWDMNGPGSSEATAERMAGELEEWEQRWRVWKRLDERERQQQEWRESGRCEICGARLSFLDKLSKRSRCEQHLLDL
jgi:WD40 repeat protein